MVSNAFAQKLDLVLKVLSISRGRLAADLGVNKSVIARWISGANEPTVHNLAALTSLVARRHAAFTLLDWDRDVTALAAMFGASVPASPETPRPEPSDFLLASRLQSGVEVEREGGAYPGVYVAFRQSFKNSGRVVPDLVVIHRQANQLFFAIYDPVFTHQGEVFILRHQLFLFGQDGERADGLTLHVLNGVVGRKAVRLDGLLLSVASDRQRTPTSAVVVLQRVADLDGSGALPQPDQLTEILTRLAALFEAGSLEGLAGPAIVAAVSSRGAAPSAPGPMDFLLRRPAERSLSASEADWNRDLEADARRLRSAVLGTDDCFEIYVAERGSELLG